MIDKLNQDFIVIYTSVLKEYVMSYMKTVVDEQNVCVIVDNRLKNALGKIF